MNEARHHSVLLDNVHSLIGRKAKKDKAQLIQEFSRLLFKNIAPSDLEGRNDIDLYGATLSLWHNFCDYDASSPYIH